MKYLIFNAIDVTTGISYISYGVADGDKDIVYRPMELVGDEIIACTENESETARELAVTARTYEKLAKAMDDFIDGELDDSRCNTMIISYSTVLPKEPVTVVDINQRHAYRCCMVDSGDVDWYEAIRKSGLEVLARETRAVLDRCNN